MSTYVNSPENEHYGLWSISTLHLTVLTYVALDTLIAWQRGEPDFITGAIYLLTFTHMAFCILRGDFTGSRKTTWILLIFALFIREMVGFISYIIPLGQMSFTLATMPVIGPYVLRFINNLNNIGLNISDLGTLLFLLVLGANITAYFKINKNGEGTLERIVAFCIVLTIAFFVFTDFLGSSISSVTTENLQTDNAQGWPQQMVLTWYFLPFYSALRALPSEQGGALLMALMLVLPVFAIFIGKPYAKGHALFFRLLAALALFSFIVLGFLGTLPLDGMTLSGTQILIAIYCSYFIFGPILTPKSAHPQD